MIKASLHTVASKTHLPDFRDCLVFLLFSFFFFFLNKVSSKGQTWVVLSRFRFLIHAEDKKYDWNLLGFLLVVGFWGFNSIIGLYIFFLCSSESFCIKSQIDAFLQEPCRLDLLLSFLWWLITANLSRAWCRWDTIQLNFWETVYWDVLGFFPPFLCFQVYSLP